MKKREIKRIAMNVRLEPEIKAKLKELAEKYNVSQNTIIANLIEKEENSEKTKSN